MPAMSPHSPPSRISPRPNMSKPNSNPFAPLSPDLPENSLAPASEFIHTTSLIPHKPEKIRHYSRKRLLSIAQDCQKRGWDVPADMTPFSAWYGVSSPSKSTQIVDPAIASIGPPGGNSRRGGFGEGFGFGGGIGGGGKGIGRGGRNIGLRRQNDTIQEGEKTIQQQMSKLVNRSGGRINEDRPPPPRQERNENRNEWRRDNNNNNNSSSSNNNNNYNRYNPSSRHQQEEEIEPAWMDDTSPDPDPAIVAMDPLIHFTPGEDMIAKHKQAMKERDLGRWRFDSAPLPPVDAKPKVFNSADYLLPNKAVTEVPDIPEPAAEPVFASRFQRFFAAEQAHPAVSPPPPAPVAKPDDHASRLMGLLSMSDQVQRETPNHHAPQHVASPPFTQSHMPSHMPHHSTPYGQNTPHDLLQQLYNPALSAPRPHHPLNMMPPHMQASGHPSYPRPPMPFYAPGPQSYQPHLPPHAVHPSQPPPGFARPPPPPLGRQQEILNTLFAGLGPR